MPSRVKQLHDKDLISPPSFVPLNIHYETMMGSVAYGVSSDASDIDLYGFCIPPKATIFPHLAGHIEGFGRQKQGFAQYQQHHIKDKETGKEYDISIYNIVKYFQLCMENNPNIIDSLFTPVRCVLHCTQIGNKVRENRKLFLHKGAWHKFKGYAFSQLHKMRTKNPKGKRAETVAKYGYDVKFAYHVVRLINEVEQILTEGDIDLTRHREHLKAIRRGEVPEEDIYKWFDSKEQALENLYANSDLQHKPDQEAIKDLLIECLEMHYEDLSDAFVQPDAAINALKEIELVLAKNRKLLR